MLKAAAGSLDFIVDTASGMHPLDPYLLLLKQEGIITIVSAPPEMKFTPVLLLIGLKTISGSMIGGMKEDLQEIILFANLLKPPLSRHKFTRANPFSHHCGTHLIKNLTQAILLLLLEMLLKEQSQVNILSPLRERGLRHSCENLMLISIANLALQQSEPVGLLKIKIEKLIEGSNKI